MKNDFKKLGYVLWFFLALLLLCHLVSCKSIDTESSQRHSDTVVVDRLVSDSSLIVKWKDTFLSYYERMLVTRRDCLVIIVDSTGNEKARQEWHDTLKDRDRQTNENKVDSVAILKSKIDSLMCIKSNENIIHTTTTEYVEKELNWLQVTLITIGVIALLAMIFKLCNYVYVHFKTPK